MKYQFGVFGVSVTVNKTYGSLNIGLKNYVAVGWCYSEPKFSPAFCPSTLSMLAFILMPDTSWLQDGCCSSRHYVHTAGKRWKSQSLLLTRCCLFIWKGNFFPEGFPWHPTIIELCLLDLWWDPFFWNQEISVSYRNKLDSITREEGNGESVWLGHGQWGIQGWEMKWHAPILEEQVEGRFWMNVKSWSLGS